MAEDIGVALNGLVFTKLNLALSGASALMVCLAGSVAAQAYGAGGGTATGTDSVAIGSGASATGDTSVAIGSNSGATSDGSVAVGWDSIASGLRSTAVGYDAEASGPTALAFGTMATATGSNAIAIGNGASATRGNQTVIGTSVHTYTLPGLASDGSRAVQGGDIRLVTADADGNLATVEADIIGQLNGAFGATTARIDSIANRVVANSAAIADNRDDILNNRDGIAMAMALKVPFVEPGASYAVSGGLGFFDGAQAFAMSGAYRVDNRTQMDAGLTYGMERQKVGGRVGVTYSW